MKETILSKTKQQSKARSHSASQTDNNSDAASLAIVGSMCLISAFIGGGALVCFIATLINAGPLELVKGFLSAVTGV